jgi:glucose-1-phosphate adenylyltransferase
VPRAEASEFGVMHVDDDQRIAAFVEKPKDPPPMPGRPDRALASMGVYVFNADFLYEQLIRDHDDPHSSHDFGKDVIPHCVKRYRVFAHNFADSCVGMDETGIPYWRDAGTIDAYWEANMELTKVTPELNLYDDDWPIWTHQEQLPPAKFVFDDDGRRGMAVDSLVSGGDIISGAVVRQIAAVLAGACAQLRRDRGLGDPARRAHRRRRQAAPGGDGQALPRSRTEC